MKTITVVVLSASISLAAGFCAGMGLAGSRTPRGADTSSAAQPARAATNYMQLDLFEAGSRSIVARPVFPMQAGVVIPVRNTATSPLTFGRFELVGKMPTISKVLVPGKAFAAKIDGDRAFTLTGDGIGADETIEVFIAFSTETSEQGALLARFNES